MIERKVREEVREISYEELKLPLGFKKLEPGKDLRLEKEVQLIKQQRLLEELRYKHYVRTGTLTSWFSYWGESLRSLFPWLSPKR